MSAIMWSIEIRSGVFTEVKARRYLIEPSGALVFTNGGIFEPELVVAYAPGQWLTLTSEEDR